MASTLSDRALVSRCRAGDQQAWNELVERFSRYVYALPVHAFRPSESDAGDRGGDRQPRPPLSRAPQRAAGGERRCRSPGWGSMTACGEEQLARRMRALPPRPEGWVRAAQGLPFVGPELDEIVARAEGDA